MYDYLNRIISYFLLYFSTISALPVLIPKIFALYSPFPLFHLRIHGLTTRNPNVSPHLEVDVDCNHCSLAPIHFLIVNTSISSIMIFFWSQSLTSEYEVHPVRISFVLSLNKALPNAIADAA